MDDKTIVDHPNMRAMSRVVREKESNQTDDAYTLLNGGGHFSGFEHHPFTGQKSPPGLAAGAHQWLASTWDEMVRQNPDDLTSFDPSMQELGFAIKVAMKNALDDVLSGNLDAVVAKLRGTWPSLPGGTQSQSTWTMDKAKALFTKWGGTLSTATVPHEQTPAAPAPVTPSTGSGSMTAMGILTLFAPILANLLPQIAKLFDPSIPVAQRNVGIAETVLNTITTTTQSGNLQEAIEKMSADPAVKLQVQQALVTQPDVMALMEIGDGGIAAARASAVVMQNAPEPFWRGPLIWVTLLLVPLVYLTVGSVLIGGSPNAPWMFGTAFNQETRSGTVNLVLGMVLGGIMGLWFGTTYGGGGNSKKNAPDVKAT